jgi:hypothetical protein
MQLFAPYYNSVVRVFFSCLSISAKTNRLFFTIGGPDGVRSRFTANSLIIKQNPV